MKSKSCLPSLVLPLQKYICHLFNRLGGEGGGGVISFIKNVLLDWIELRCDLFF